MKEIKILFLIIFALINSQQSFCQTIFSGLVLDSLTNQPIIGARIINEETQKETISNEEGAFDIIVSSLPAKLAVFHISYKKLQIEVQNTNKTIILSEATRTLPTPDDPLYYDGWSGQNPVLDFFKIVIDQEKTKYQDFRYTKMYFKKLSYGLINSSYEEAFYNEARKYRFGAFNWNDSNVRYANPQKSMYDLTFGHFYGNSIEIPYHISFPFLKRTSSPTQYYIFKVSYYLNKGKEDEVVVIKCVQNPTNNQFFRYEGEYFFSVKNYNLLYLKGSYKTIKNKKNKTVEDIQAVFFEEKDGRAYFNNVFISKINFGKKSSNSSGFLYAIENLKNEKNLKYSMLKFGQSYLWAIPKKKEYNSEIWQGLMPIKRTKKEIEEIELLEKSNKFISRGED
jgi:CarboxypepD_reg-like domain